MIAQNRQIAFWLRSLGEKKEKRERKKKRKREEMKRGNSIKSTCTSEGSLLILTLGCFLFSSISLKAMASNSYDPNAPLFVFFGDSATTGATSNPRLKLNAGDIVRALGSNLIFETIFGVSDPPSWRPREADAFIEDFSEGDQIALLQRERPLALMPRHWDFPRDQPSDPGPVKLLNSLAHTWSNLLLAHLGYESSQGVMIAQDGQPSSKLVDQVRRFHEIQEVQDRKLNVFLQFTGNDLCGKGALRKTLDEIESEITQNYLRGLYDLAEKSGDKILEINILPFLDLSQIFTNQSLLEQKVEVQGTQMSCKEFREGSFPVNRTFVLDKHLAREMLIPLFKNTCPNFMPFVELSESQVMDMKSKINAARRAQIRAAETFFKSTSIPTYYISSLENLKFESGDLGADCFHPGLQLHSKIANEIFRSIQQEVINDEE